ncbi:hypothetical protein ACFL3W_01350 [Pseudomonadota bacterium]
MNHEEWISVLRSGELEPKRLIQMAINQAQGFTWHPLGFVMSQLSENEEKKIRLHLWPEDRSKAQEPFWAIHDHLFNLNSWLISGSIKNIEYETIDESNEYCLYEARYVNNSSQLIRLDKFVGIVQTKTTLVEKGDYYEINAGVFHQSASVGSSTAVTVCETSKKLNRHPWVIGEVKGDPIYTFERSKVSDSELNKIVSKI